MRTHNIPSCYRKVKEIIIMPPDLTLLPTLIGSNYPCLELIFMAPKVFEPLKFDCTSSDAVFFHKMQIACYVKHVLQIRRGKRDHFPYYYVYCDPSLEPSR